MKSMNKIISLFCALTILAGLLVSPASASYNYVDYPMEGDYYICPEANTNYALDLSGGGTATYTFFQLYQCNGTGAQIFTIKRVGGEWYKLVHKESGKVVNVESGISKNDARLWLYPDDGTASCYFRFVKIGGTDSYVIQNQINPYRVLDLDNARTFNGSIVHLWDQHVNLSARWQLIPVSSGRLPTISGHNVPSSIPSGKAFSITGIINSPDSNLTYVDAGVYHSNGALMTGKAATPNARSFDLKKLDPYILFNKVPDGTYTYRVTARNSAGLTTLIEATFTIGNTATANYEKAWFPAPVMRLTQLAYESYSHGNSNVIDIAPGGRVFAPFTGKIVYKNANWGYVMFQSLDKVQYADGTVDYLTIGLMHDSDISDLYVGQIIQQGQTFYDAGGMGAGNPNAYAKHVEIGLFRGRVNSPPNPSKLCNGNVYAYNALFINSSKTSIVNKGRMEQGNYMTNGAPSDWSNLWKNC